MHFLWIVVWCIGFQASELQRPMCVRCLASTKTLILHTKVGKKVYHRIMKIKQEKKYSKFAGDLNEPKSQCHFILFPFRSNSNELSTCNTLDTLTNICTYKNTHTHSHSKDEEEITVFIFLSLHLSLHLYLSASIIFIRSTLEKNMQGNKTTKVIKALEVIIFYQMLFWLDENSGMRSKHQQI